MKSKLWTDNEIALLGTATDKAVAEQIGRTEGATRKKRRELGIPPSRTVATGNQAAARPWTWDEIKLLGAAPDKEVAAKLGRSLPSVTYKRIRMEIAAYNEPMRKPTTPRRKNPLHKPSD